MHVKERWMVGASGIMTFENIFKNAFEIGTRHCLIHLEDDKNPDPTQWHAVEESAKYIQNAPFVK